MQKILITILAILICAPAGAESVRERLERARAQERQKRVETDTTAPGDVPQKHQPKDGIVREEYPNGVVRSLISYSEGKLEGETKLFYEDGTPLSVTRYANDLAEGLSQQYFPSGKVKVDETFEAGILDGTRTEYYEDGTIKLEEVYDDGKLDGPKTLYHPNGKVQSKAEYNDGTPEGVVSEYFLPGQLASETFFENGNKIWEKNYIYNQKSDIPYSELLYVQENIMGADGSLSKSNHYDASGKLIYSQ